MIEFDPTPKTDGIVTPPAPVLEETPGKIEDGSPLLQVPSYIEWATFDPETGEIQSTGSSTPEDMKNLVEATQGKHYFVGPKADATLHWIDPVASSLQEKQSMNIQQNGNVISGVPNPSSVIIGVEEFLVTDGTIEVTFDMPGTHVVTIKSPRHLTKDVVVEQA